MRLLMIVLALVLIGIGSASTTTFDLGNYTVGMDYMPLDTKYAHVDIENATGRMVRWSWGSFDPGAWTAITIIEVYNRSIFNLSDTNSTYYLLLGTAFLDANRTAESEMTSEYGVAAVDRPCLGVIVSGTLERDGSKINAYAGAINNSTVITVISNGNDNTFGSVLDGLVITEKKHVPQMRANTIAARLNA
jgi:hypothetical protein